MRSGLADFEPGEMLTAWRTTSVRLESVEKAVGRYFYQTASGAKQIEDEVQRTEFLAGMNEMRSRLTTQMAVLFAVRNGTALGTGRKRCMTLS